MVEAVSLHIKDACVLKYTRYEDHRGYLEEIYNEEKYPADIVKHFSSVKQNTVASSHKNALRGIHISPYAKLLTCVRGSVYDVVVDLRCESPTYLKWAAVILSDSNHRQLFIPPYCGHGYYALQEASTVVYVQGGIFNSPYEGGISPFDDIVDIHWPIPEGVTPHLSEKDKIAPCLTLSPRFSVSVHSKRKRILIIGASGQVGGAITEAISKQSGTYVAVGTYHTHHQESLVFFSMEEAASNPALCEDLMTLCHPHIVCICAAFTWVEGNEQNPEKARAINVTAVLNVAKAAKRIGAKTVFYSSDYVYSGRNTSLSDQNKAVILEDYPADPVCVYGQLKREAEQRLMEEDPTSLILRISRVYGPEHQGKNFVYAINNAANRDKPVKCLTTEISCPTYNRDVAQATLALMERNCAGIYHCVGPEALSKYEWGMQVCNLLGKDRGLITGVDTLDQSAAKRPENVALSTSKLREELPDFRFRTVEEAFRDWKCNPVGKPLVCQGN